MLRDSKEKFPTRLWVLLPKLSVRFIVCKQKRVVRVKDHKSVLSCFHVKIDLTDEQMDFKYWQMGNEIKRIRIRVVPRSKIDFVSKRMCNFKSISSETEFFFAKTRRKILSSSKDSDFAPQNKEENPLLLQEANAIRDIACIFLRKTMRLVWKIHFSHARFVLTHKLEMRLKAAQEWRFLCHRFR